MTGLEDFIDACRKGRTALVQDWIATGRRVNEPGSGKTTALMAAAEHGRLDIVKLLVDAGGDVCFRGAGGWTALMLAARGGHHDVVEHLLTAGADPSSETILRDTAHSLALANGKMRVAQLLEKAGSTVNAKALHDVAHEYVVNKALATRDYTPRARKAAANKAENLRPRLESIIAAGAEGGDYPLWEATKYRQRDTVRMLLAAKANPNASPHGTSALSTACEKRDLVTAQLLLDSGADPNFGGKTDEPLLVAIEKNSRQLVAELIRRGANVNVQRPRGITPLLLATSKNNLALMRALLDAGANPNLAGTAEIGPALKTTVTKERIEDSILEFKTTHVLSAPAAANVTPLIVAARRDFRDATKLLLKHGAEAEFKDAEGMTAPAWAKKLRHTWIQGILLAHGANAFASIEGSLDNALLTAARKGNLARVQQLLAKGANANAHIDSADKRRTPLGEAAQHGSAKVIESLLNAGAEVDKPTAEMFGPRDVTPLMIAAEAGYAEAVAALLKAGANIDARDSGPAGTGATPLHYAARGGNPEVLKLLIAAGADVSKRDQFKTTPMHSAASHGRAEAIDVLLQHTTIRTTKGVSEALSLAAISRHVAAVKRILVANPKCHDNDPEFAVSMAFSGRLEIIKELVKAGMRFDQKNRDGWTPLRMAKKAGRTKVIELLKIEGAK